MRRIAVIGCGGAGKTTLSRELGRMLDLPVLHIDAYHWRHDDGPSDEWPQVHHDLVSRDRWIIDGMKPGVLPARLERADAVIFLDLPRWMCLWGVVQRRLEFRGRCDPALGVYDSINGPFIRWIWSFRRRQRRHILALLDNCSCDVMVFRRRRQVRHFLAALRQPRSDPRIVWASPLVDTNS